MTPDVVPFLLPPETAPKAEICILGIDPGLSGAVAFYFPSHPHLIAAEDMPVAGGEIDAATLARRVSLMVPTIAVIERVHAMPGQGVSSTFKFGTAYGTVLGAIIALGVTTHLVAPTKWKRYFGLSADKEEARALALRLWPTSEHFARKKDHGRAEAALIARWAAETIPGARDG